MNQLPNTVALGWRDTLIGFVEQVRQRTLREIWTTDRQPLTKKCGVVVAVDHEQKLFTNLRTSAAGYAPTFE